MNCKFWGPHGKVYFMSVATNYPERYDADNAEHVTKAFYIRELFHNLAHTLPCRYCRESYQQFIEELPMEPYMGGSRDLMYWFYLIIDKVNKKLIGQEQEAYASARRDLAASQHRPVTRRQDRTLRHKWLYTKPSPPFETLCRRYDNQRAVCSNRRGVQSCRVPAALDPSQ